MGQIGLILLLLVVPLADDTGLSPEPAGWWLWPVQFSVPIAIWYLERHRQARRKRAGSLGLVHQNAVLAWHIASVVLLGWGNQVRTLTGDVVAFDELIVALPAMAAWIAGPAMGTRLRVEILPIAMPVLALQAWSEGVGMYLSPVIGEAWGTPVRLLGVLGLVLVAPLALRFLWSTRPLREGSLRHRIEDALGAARVRVGEILMWNTRGRIANAAVVGVLPGMRFILLSDALLSALTADEVESVAAHEIGHVRHRHIAWLMLTLVASLLAGMGAVTLLGLVGGWADAAALGASGVGVFLGFGLVSRVFERQADAFAVAHLSRSRGEDSVTGGAADVFAGALGKVSLMGGLPRHRWTWRHGSIAGRQRRVHALVGQPIGRLAPDRAARITARTVLCTCILSLAAVLFGGVMHG